MKAGASCSTAGELERREATRRGCAEGQGTLGPTPGCLAGCMKRIGRVAAGLAVAAVCGVLAGLLADSVIHVAGCRTGPPSPFDGATFYCPDSRSGVLGLGAVAAVTGFWFCWTGRLARLFMRSEDEIQRGE